MFHIRFAGRVFEIKPKVFELSLQASDGEILSKTADWLGVPETRLDDYVIERVPGTTVIVRPRVR
jgi:hypothetical protein